MKDQPTRNPDGEHLLFQLVLLALLLTAILLWFIDPNHRPTGGSRIAWPTWSQPGH